MNITAKLGWAIMVFVIVSLLFMNIKQEGEISACIFWAGLLSVAVFLILPQKE